MLSHYRGYFPCQHRSFFFLSLLNNLINESPKNTSKDDDDDNRRRENRESTTSLDRCSFGKRNRAAEAIKNEIELNACADLSSRINILSSSIRFTCAAVAFLSPTPHPQKTTSKATAICKRHDRAFLGQSTVVVVYKVDVGQTCCSGGDDDVVVGANERGRPWRLLALVRAPMRYSVDTRVGRQYE